MFTYQIRPRVFRHKKGEELQLPADCVVSFHFQPLQPFGESHTGGRTVVKAAPTRVFFSANTGVHYAESTPPLAPLDVAIEDEIRTIRLTGKTLTVSQRIESMQELEQLITSLYFVLPPLLNINFADPPYIERVDGVIGQHGFRWELAEWGMEFHTTDQEKQEAHVTTAWKRIGLLSEPTRRRLIAGLHYFHQACRLSRASATVGEFLAEVVLNLSKCLEVLFPPKGDGRTRDAIRSGLRTLGIADRDIECNFLPAVALRNEIDVGHVELGLFTLQQLKVIHQFTERAEGAFRRMLDQILEQVESAKFEVAAYTDCTPRTEAIRLIKRLQECSRHCGSKDQRNFDKPH
jgi:hypothetical protein